jgi:4-hydroxythreonine-4-phosphate dehydrogenase
MEEKKLKIGITQGDINGTGYEVILKMLSDVRILELCTPVIYGSSNVLAYHRKTVGLEPVNVTTVHSAQEATDNRISIINTTTSALKVDLAQSTAIAGEAALQAIEKAVRDLKEGAIDALLTAPVNRQNTQYNQIPFPGHSEYLQQTCGNGKKTLTVLSSEKLLIAPVTDNIPLSEVSSRLSMSEIGNKLKAFHQTLIQDFGFIRPRIAVLSLNPRTGKTGRPDTEEHTVILPAIREAEKQGLLVFGPFAADNFFGSGNYGSYDGVLAMYHDQAMIAFKALVAEEGAVLTAGLPVVRTAPVHGVDYDIAGKNLASEQSFRCALYLAIDVYRCRKNYLTATANPLRKQYFEKGSDNEKPDLTKDEY